MTNVPLRVAQGRGAVALASREVRRVLLLGTQTILPPVVTAGLFLAIFGGVLGERMRRLEGLEYFEFILPGLLVLTVASSAVANASTSFFQAKSEGYIEDVLMAPLAAWQIVLAYMVGGVVRSLAAAFLIVVGALPFAGAPEHSLVAIMALVLTALVFSALGAVVGVWADTYDQHSFVTAIVVTPLALLGGVFYSARMLDPPWSTVVRLDPLYYLVDATRFGFSGVHESRISTSLGLAALAGASMFAIGTLIVARGWRLRP